MKKIVKLFGLMTIAAFLAVSCSKATETPDTPANPDSGTGSEAAAPTTTDTTTTTTDTTTKTDPEKESWNGSVDLSKVVHNLADWCKGWGEATNKCEYTDGKIILTTGNGWANTIDIPLEKDVSEFTKVSIKANVNESWTAEKAIKLEMTSSETAASEYCSDYGDKTFLVLSSTSTVTSINLADAGKLWGDSIESKADLTSIKTLRINPQDGTGVLTIESIIFE